jgi:hypothetical protein
MNPETAPSPVEVLQAYGQQQAGEDEVMRCLVSYRGWFAPATEIAFHYQRKRVDKLVTFSTATNYPENELWLFTDIEAANRAQSAGAELGSYGGCFAGTELFGNLNPAMDMVRVNPGSPREMTWVIGKGAFTLAQIWAESFLLEERFDQWQSAGQAADTEVLAAHRGFLLFNHPNGYVATLVGAAGLTNGCAVFTAPDCCKAFLAALSEEQAGSLSRVVADGRQLLDVLPQQGVDGMLFNAFGPGVGFVFRFSGS